jgi:hypothetical protein
MYNLSYCDATTHRDTWFQFGLDASAEQQRQYLLVWYTIQKGSIHCAGYLCTTYLVAHDFYFENIASSSQIKLILFAST